MTFFTVVYQNLVNIDMSIEYYAKIIQEIIDKAAEKKNFATSRDELIWRYGFTIGLLCRYATEDNYLSNKIERRHERDTGKKKR
jgi:hypothetical protein